MNIYREEFAKRQRLDVRPQGDATEGSFVLNKEAGKCPGKPKATLVGSAHFYAVPALSRTWEAPPALRSRTIFTKTSPE